MTTQETAPAEPAVEITEEAILAIIEEVAPGTPAYCEQTGGGTATIMVGAPRAATLYPDEGDYFYLLNIGPGWFTDATWQHGVFSLGDLYLGPGDSSGDFDAATITTPDELRAALVTWLTETPDWRDIDPIGVSDKTDTRCPKCNLYTTGLRYESNGGTWHRRCEKCDVQECGDCGEWVEYVEGLGVEWRHVSKYVECFLSGPGDAEIAPVGRQVTGTAVIQQQPSPRQAREDQARRFAASLGLDPDRLVRGAEAAWSNLNPQSVNYNYALSVAAVVLAAADKVGE